MHVIRLRAPWQVEALPDAGIQRLRYRRRFGCPTGLTPRERVWLVIENGGACNVTLNGEPLGATVPSAYAEFDISALLRPRNEVWLDLADVADAAASMGDVRLEIREM